MVRPSRMVSFNPPSCARCWTPILALLALVVGAPSTQAEVIVEGTPAAIRITAKQAPLADVFSALGKTFKVRYEALVSLDTTINGTYSGPLDSVVLRLLNGFNFIITTRDGALEVMIISRPGTAPVQATATQPAPPANTSPVAQWRSSNTPTRKP